MKQLLTLKDCVECGDCCYYYKGYLALAPRFSREEAKKISKENLIDKKTHFVAGCQRRKNSNYFFCDFKEGEMCLLKEKRPFGCKLYPFNVMKDRKGKIVLGIDWNCKGVKSRTKEQIDEYAKKIIPFVRRKIRQNPFLVEEFQGGLKILFVL